MKVLCLKLTTGEDLICKISSNILTEGQLFNTKPYSVPKGQVTLEDVLVLSVQQVSPTQTGMMLIPWQLGDYEAPVTADLSSFVIAIYAPTVQVEEAYLKQTSKLALPSHSGKIAVPGIKM